MKAFLDSIFKVRPTDIPPLNGLRAFAIISVALGHLIGGMFYRTPEVARQHWLGPVLENSDIGVDLFFMLSGFLISLGLKQRFAKDKKGIFLQFYKRRTLRIFPAYYAYIGISWAMVSLQLQAARAQNRTGEWIEFLTTVQGRAIFDALYVSNWFGGLQPHTWSLSTEEQFYLAFPWLFVFFLSGLAFRSRMVFFSSVFVIAAVGRVLFAISDPAGDSFVGHFAIWFRLFRFDILGLGVLLMEIYTERMPSLTTQKSLLLALAGIALIVSGMYLEPIVGNRLYRAMRYSFFGLGLFPLFLLALHGKNLFSRFLSLNVWVPVARLSYTVYLWHFILIMAIAGKIFDLQNTDLSAMRIALICIVTLPVVLAVSALPYAVFEYPFLRIKAKQE